MALDALATPTALAERLGVAEPDRQSQTTDWNRWDTALLDASNELRRIIGQPLTAATDSFTVVLDSCGRGLIPVCPVRSVTAVDVNAGALVAGVDYQLEDDGQHIRALRQLPRSQSGDVQLTVAVQHGWTEVPGDVLRWVYVLAVAQIIASQRGNLGASGITQASLDDARFAFNDGPFEIPVRVQNELRAAYGGVAQ